MISSWSHQNRLVLQLLLTLTNSSSYWLESISLWICTRPWHHLLFNWHLSHRLHKAITFLVFWNYFSWIFIWTGISQDRSMLRRLPFWILHCSTGYVAELMWRIVIWTWILVGWEQHRLSFFGPYVIKSVIARCFSFFSNIIEFCWWVLIFTMDHPFIPRKAILGSSMKVNGAVFSGRRKSALFSMRKRSITSSKIILSSV